MDSFYPISLKVPNYKAYIYNKLYQILDAPSQVVLAIPVGCINDEVLLVDRCVGLTDDQIVRGTCEDRDPCDPNPCSLGAQCVPHHRMCLSLGQMTCQQHDCGEGRTLKF